MILDTSALVAVLRDELEAPAFTQAMETASQLRMSAANVLESAIVIDGARNLLYKGRDFAHTDVRTA